MTDNCMFLAAATEPKRFSTTSGRGSFLLNRLVVEEEVSVR
jgi:hypothetical protein